MLKVLARCGSSTLLRSGSAQCLTNTQRRYLPVCTVDTNLKQSDVPSDFGAKFSKLIATALNKPESLISLAVRPDVQIMRDGNENPTAMVQIQSVGVFDETKNVEYAKIFFPFLVEELKLPVERITVLLTPLQRHDASHLLYADHLKQHS